MPLLRVRWGRNPKVKELDQFKSYPKDRGTVQWVLYELDGRFYITTNGRVQSVSYDEHAQREKFNRFKKTLGKVTNG